MIRWLLVLPLAALAVAGCGSSSSSSSSTTSSTASAYDSPEAVANTITKNLGVNATVSKQDTAGAAPDGLSLGDCAQVEVSGVDVGDALLSAIDVCTEQSLRAVGRDGFIDCVFSTAPDGAPCKRAAADADGFYWTPEGGGTFTVGKVYGANVIVQVEGVESRGVIPPGLFELDGALSKL